MLYILIVSIIVIFFIGYITCQNRIKALQEKLDFAHEYHQKFVQFANKFQTGYRSIYGIEGDGAIDKELYIWLTMNANRIQVYLGATGKIHYKPPYASHIIQNYALIVNSLPKFRTQNIDSFDISSCDDALIRYIGNMNFVLERLIKSSRNPLVVFRTGFEQIASIPLEILRAFGVIDEESMRQISSSVIYRFVTGIIGLIGLVASIVQLIQLRGDPTSFIKGLFGTN